MRTHYSERLGRNYEHDDMLDRHEVAAILSINSGRTVEPWYVSDLVYKNVLLCERPSPRKLLIQYKDVRNYIVSKKTGPKPQAAPNANAQRQRAFKARRAAGPASDDQGDRLSVAV